MYRLPMIGFALLALAAPAFGANVSVGISIGAPGYYGPLDVQGFPQPQLVYPEPVIIQPLPPGVVGEPLYLRVPPDQAQHWAKHCERYGACGRPVYFVQDHWYRDVYVPQYQHGHGHPHAHQRGHHGHDDD